MYFRGLHPVNAPVDSAEGGDVRVKYSHDSVGVIPQGWIDVVPRLFACSISCLARTAFTRVRNVCVRTL